jgi:hypothetical protein
MRIALLTAALAATTLSAIPAQAQDTRREADREYRNEVRDARRDYRNDLRDADSRRDVRDARREYAEQVRDARRDRREDLRDIRQDRRDDWRRYRNYDYNRLPPGQRAYYAENYYRDGRYYQPRRLTRNDRIYRGGNGRYYCRRNDGTTGSGGRRPGRRCAGQCDRGRRIAPARHADRRGRRCAARPVDRSRSGDLPLIVQRR